MAKSTGRRPRGPYTNNSEMLAVRVQPELKAGIADLASRLGFSTSQQVQRALRDWLRRHDPAGAHVEMLAGAVALMVCHIEQATEKKWTADTYTADAVFQGMR